jgi:hypothetical protein
MKPRSSFPLPHMLAFTLALWATQLCARAELAVADAAVIDLIADTSFARGVQAEDRASNSQIIAWDPAQKSSPVWKVAQHHSRSNVADPAHQQLRPGGFTFKDDFAWLEFRPRDSDADLILGLNAFREYEGRYRAPGDPWPHLYVSQRISSPGGHLGGRAPSLAQLAQVDFAVSVRLLHDHRHLGEGYNPRVHASQFLFFLTIQNLNRASPGYGDYYWFGVTFYDDRKPLTALQAQRDQGSPRKQGTGKLIYNIGLAPFTDQVVAAGEWVSIEGDLLPHLLAGLREAWRQGYLSGSAEVADYRIGSVVIGWEIPGLNDAAAALKGLRLTAAIPTPANPRPQPAITR